MNRGPRGAVRHSGAAPALRARMRARAERSLSGGRPHSAGRASFFGGRPGPRAAGRSLFARSAFRRFFTVQRHAGEQCTRRGSRAVNGTPHAGQVLSRNVSKARTGTRTARPLRSLAVAGGQADCSVSFRHGSTLKKTNPHLALFADGGVF